MTWLVGALLILVAGSLLRLALGGFNVPTLSAAGLGTIVWIGVWLAALLLARPRVAFIVGLAAMAMLHFGALPPRPSVEFDDRQALYRIDQFVTTRVTPAVGDTLLLALVEPAFSGPQPRFGLVGEIGSARATWTCPFRHGMQRLALPLPQSISGPIDLKLGLTGSPARDGDYLLVYGSARQGGPLLTTASASTVGSDVVRCASL
jgi:hypothetical protein